MTRTLILMRHAKSSWDNPFLADHDRPLNKRGHKSARATGDWLKQQGLIPDQVISSTSKRTFETFEGLGLDVRPTFTRRLYHADTDQMWEVLSSAQGTCVLMLGHNPGIAEFAAEIVAIQPDHPRFWDYPTCATLVADFPVDAWTDARPHTAVAQEFVIPRELLE